MLLILKRNSKIPKGETEIVKSEDRQDHGQPNETKDKHGKYNTTLKTKGGVTWIQQKPGWVQVLRKGISKNIYENVYIIILRRVYFNILIILNSTVIINKEERVFPKW